MMPAFTELLFLLKVNKSVDVQQADKFFERFIPVELSIVQIMRSSYNDWKDVEFQQHPTDFTDSHVGFIEVMSRVKISQIYNTVRAHTALEVIQLFADFIGSRCRAPIYRATSFLADAEYCKVSTPVFRHFFSKYVHTFKKA